MTSTWKWGIVIVIGGLMGVAGAAARAAVPQLEGIMYRDPELPRQPTERRIPEDLLRLWRIALAGPEAELQCEAATMILRCHQQGYPGLEQTAGDLLRALAQSQHPVVRRCIASALIELNAKQAASQLYELTQQGGTTEALLIEPALARWDFRPIREVWLQRLIDPEVARPQLLLAIESVQRVGETEAASELRELALNPLAGHEVRLAAARALGTLQSDGLTDDAKRLARDPSPQSLLGRLVAAHLLTRHRGPEAERLLLELAVDDAPAVAAIAWRTLLDIDPDLTQPIIPQGIANPDANVRRLAAQALVERPTAQVFSTLGQLLDDVHPEVRTYVRESLRQLAELDEFDAPVRETALHVLASDRWRGLEQAARLLGELDHKPAAERLTELLSFDRPEVFVTAAWSLRVLAVRDVLPEMLRFVETKVQPGGPDESPPRVDAALDACLSQLFQAFGAMRYAEAEPVLVPFVPRRSDEAEEARVSAIWALGHLHANQATPELVELFASRVADEAQLPRPESINVRAMAAVGLGRLNARSVLETMQQHYDHFPPGSPIREGLIWAIEQMTGTDIPPLPLKYVVPLTGFLQPTAPVTPPPAE